MVRLFNAAGMTPCRGKNSALRSSANGAALHHSSESPAAGPGEGVDWRGERRFRVSAWIGPGPGPEPEPGPGTEPGTESH